MDTKHKWRRKRNALALLAGALLELALLGGRAEAVIGRPLTPFSYAGVARRTTRRAAVVGAATAPRAYGYPTPAPYASPYPTPAPYYW